MPLVSIILPTYNEAENIIPLIQEIEKTLKTGGLPAYAGGLPNLYEIVVVDDNSPDGTSLLVRDYIKQKKTKHVRLETRTKDRGLTKSIDHGIRVARGDIIVWLDCDFSMPPTLIPKLIAELQTGYDGAIGSRFVPGGKQKQPSQHESPIAIVLSTIMNRTLQLVFQVKIHDFTSGFIAIKQDVVRQLLPLRGDYGEYFIELMIRAHRQGYTIKELPYINAPRRAGESKTAPDLKTGMKRAVQYGRTILKLMFTLATSSRT